MLPVTECQVVHLLSAAHHRDERSHGVVDSGGERERRKQFNTLFPVFMTGYPVSDSFLVCVCVCVRVCVCACVHVCMCGLIVVCLGGFFL